MKLRDWVVRDAIERGDWLTAANAVADMFNLEKFDAASPAILEVIINKANNNQVRIATAGRVYAWHPNARYSVKVGYDNVWIAIWGRIP